MAIPSAVQRQAEEADRLYKEGLKPADPPETNPPPNPDPAIHEQPPVEETDYKALYEEERQKNATLRGKFDSEVPYLTDMNRKMAEELSNLKIQVSEISKKPADPPQEDKRLKELTNDVAPEFLETMGLMIQKATRELETKIFNRIKTELLPTVETIGRKVEQTSQKSFAQQMDTLVRDEKGPIWRQINDSSEFTQYLKTTTYGGISKWDILQAALGQGNAEGVADIFNEYRKLKHPGLRVVKGAPSSDPEGDVINPPAPGGGGRPPAPPANQNKKTVSRSYIKAFHTAKATRKPFVFNGDILARVGDKKTWDKLEAEINDALQGMRVTEN